MLTQQVLERSSVDELHPDPDTSVDLIGTEDGDDVRMADSRQQAAFLDGMRTSGGIVAVKQLQRHVARKARIPGAIDRAECAGTQALANFQDTPLRQLAY